MFRFNSTIKVKMGCCPECNDGRSKPLIGGLCQYHYKTKKGLRRMSGLKKDLALKLWYDGKMLHSEPVCDNCGMRADWLKGIGCEKIWHACQAHILPKKKDYGFPSIATDPDNHLVLFPSWGGLLCGCHGAYDSNWERAAGMKVFTLAKQRFAIFEANIDEEERKRIPIYFLTNN